jgi:hypothetical protein
MGRWAEQNLFWVLRPIDASPKEPGRIPRNCLRTFFDRLDEEFGGLHLLFGRLPPLTQLQQFQMLLMQTLNDSAQLQLIK